MVQSCCAYNCAERHKSGSGISFHAFPKDTTLKKRWIRALRRENFNPSKHTRICSKHFTSDSFDTSPWSSKKSLKNDAVPSIFDFPDDVSEDEPEPQTEQTFFLDIVKIEPESFTPVVESSGRKKRFSYVGDFEDYSSIDDKYKQAVKKLLTKKQKQIKVLQQQNRRLTKKISNLNCLLEHLEQERINEEESSLKLPDTLPASTKIILKQLSKSKDSGTYPSELKTFALTLNFYSPKAYSYVRMTFPNMLPHPRTLQKWCQAGACQEDIQTEQENLSQEEMELDGETFVGYADLENEIQEAYLSEETGLIVG